MPQQQIIAYPQVKSRYQGLRDSALEIAHASLPPVLSNKRGIAIVKSAISLEGFTFKSQHALKRWESEGVRRAAWDWDAVQKKYKAHPKRFELTVWHQGVTLCGASIGKPTRGGGKLRLDYLEAAPMGTPLDGLITDISLAAGVLYARSIGAAQIRIMNPVNNHVRDHYTSKPGFSYNERDNYCFRDLL